jgi:hypothetical protein
MGELTDLFGNSGTTAKLLDFLAESFLANSGSIPYSVGDLHGKNGISVTSLREVAIPQLMARGLMERATDGRYAVALDTPFLVTVSLYQSLKNKRLEPPPATPA